jgi:hypothetical protein
MQAHIPPILEAVGKAFEKAFGFMMDHKEILVGIITALVVGMTAYAASAIAAAAATLVTVAAFVAIGVAIAAVVAGVIYAYKHWGWFHTAVDKAWQIMQDVAHWFVDTFVPFIRNEVIPVIVDIGTNVANIAQKLAGITVEFWRFLGEVREVAMGAINAFIGIAEAISAPFREAFNGIASAWNATVGKLSFHAPDWIPGIGGKGWDVPDLPHFAKGGIMPGAKGQPGLAVLHGGERVVPNGGGGQAIQINIDGRSFMTWFVDYSRDAGGIPITTRAAS